jgi:hypothetical protein
MSLISAALTLFALLLLTQIERRRERAVWLGGLAVALYLLPGRAKVAAPIAVILTLGLSDSIASLRPR